MSLLFAIGPDSSTVINFFISYNPYIFNHKYMNDTNSYRFDIQSIIFVYINTVPLILNYFQYLFLSYCIIPLEIIYSSIIDKLTVFFKQIIITINALIFR